MTELKDVMSLVREFKEAIEVCPTNSPHIDRGQAAITLAVHAIVEDNITLARDNAELRKVLAYLATAVPWRHTEDCIHRLLEGTATAADRAALGLEETNG